MSEINTAAIKSVARVFEVFELFDRVRAPVNAMRVSRELDYPQSSALALLKSMVNLGYLAFDRIERTYMPTMRMGLLCGWLESALHGDGNLQALMDEVTQVTGEAVALAVQNDLLMQMIHLRKGRRPFDCRIHPGDSFCLFRSAAGITSLSSRSDAEITRLWKRYALYNRHKGPTIELHSVLSGARHVRQHGYKTIRIAEEPATGAISWLVPVFWHRPSLVMSVAGPAARIQAHEKQIVEAVTQALARYENFRAPTPERLAV